MLLLLLLLLHGLLVVGVATTFANINAFTTPIYEELVSLHSNNDFVNRADFEQYLQNEKEQLLTFAYPADNAVMLLLDAFESYIKCAKDIFDNVSSVSSNFDIIGSLNREEYNAVLTHLDTACYQHLEDISKALSPTMVSVVPLEFNHINRTEALSVTPSEVQSHFTSRKNSLLLAEAKFKNASAAYVAQYSESKSKLRAQLRANLTKELPAFDQLQDAMEKVEQQYAVNETALDTKMKLFAKKLKQEQDHALTVWNNASEAYQAFATKALQLQMQVAEKKADINAEFNSKSASLLASLRNAVLQNHSFQKRRRGRTIYRRAQRDLHSSYVLKRKKIATERKKFKTEVLEMQKVEVERLEKLGSQRRVGIKKDYERLRIFVQEHFHEYVERESPSSQINAQEFQRLISDSFTKTFHSQSQ